MQWTGFNERLDAIKALRGGTLDEFDYAEVVSGSSGDDLREAAAVGTWSADEARVAVVHTRQDVAAIQTLLGYVVRRTRCLDDIKMWSRLQCYALVFLVVEVVWGWDADLTVGQAVHGVIGWFTASFDLMTSRPVMDWPIHLFVLSLYIAFMVVLLGALGSLKLAKMR